MEGLRRSGELAGNRDGYSGGQAGIPAGQVFTQAAFPSFLDAWKAYDSLDMGRCLEVLRGEGLGPNMARLVTSYWYQQRIVSKSGKFLGKYFWAGRGVTQGDPMSPMIFNIVVDAVVRAFLDVVCGTQEAQHVLGWLYGEKNLVFYANDGKIVGQDHKWV